MVCDSWHLIYLNGGVMFKFTYPAGLELIGWSKRRDQLDRSLRWSLFYILYSWYASISGPILFLYVGGDEMPLKEENFAMRSWWEFSYSLAVSMHALYHYGHERGKVIHFFPLFPRTKNSFSAAKPLSTSSYIFSIYSECASWKKFELV